MSDQFFHDPRGDPKSLLVINPLGVISRIYTPFKVICVIPVVGISTGAQVYVDEVQGFSKGDLYFFIFKQPYSHKNFQILIKF